MYNTNMQRGPERLEGSHTQVTVLVTDTAAAKRGMCAPIAALGFLLIVMNGWMSLWLGRPHLKRTV